MLKGPQIVMYFSYQKPGMNQDNIIDGDGGGRRTALAVEWTQGGVWTESVAKREGGKEV